VTAGARHRWRVTVALVAGFVAGIAGCAPPPPTDAFITARVTRIADGDSFRARTDDGLALEVRVAEIDTPERGEPWSARARDALQRLVGGRRVRLEPFDFDRYGRLVARVRAGERDVAATLVTDGLAVVYRRHAVDPELYRLEARARAARRGVWSGRAIPRGAGRTPRQPGRVRAEPPWRRHCAGAAPGCAALESCAAALYHQRRCGHTGLDDDRDGIPCERLCRRR